MVALCFRGWDCDSRDVWILAENFLSLINVESMFQVLQLEVFNLALVSSEIFDINKFQLLTAEWLVNMNNDVYLAANNYFRNLAKYCERYNIGKHLQSLKYTYMISIVVQMGSNTTISSVKSQGQLQLISSHLYWSQPQVVLATCNQSSLSFCMYSLNLLAPDILNVSNLPRQWRSSGWNIKCNQCRVIQESSSSPVLINPFQQL